MAQYDISSKVLFADYERDFIVLTLGTDDFEVVGKIPTEFPSVQMRMTDAPMRVRLGNGQEVIVHIEFQTETSRDPMEFRIAEYVGRLLHEYQLPVYVTVIYLSPSAGASDPGGYGYNHADTFSYALRYQVIRLEDIDGEEILNQKSLIGLIPFSGLMKHSDEISSETWLDRCVQTILEIPLESEEKQRDYIASFCVLSRLVYPDNLIQQVLEEKKLMIDIENSPFIKIFTDKARAEERRQLERELQEERQKAERELQERQKAEREFQEERQKAERELQEERQNVSETRKETEVEAYANALLHVIHQVFGLRGKEQLEPRIREIRDSRKLVSLITPVLQSATVDEFKQVLEDMETP